MEYHEFAPPAELRPFVRCLWTLGEPRAEAARHAPVEPIVPDGCMELVVHHGDRFARIARSGRPEMQGRAFFVGQTHAPFRVVPTGTIGVVGARFRIGGASPWLRGIRARSLVESELALDQLWPRATDELVERIARTGDAALRARVLAGWLVARVRPEDSHPAVGAAANWLERTRGARDVGELALDLGLSPRQVQRVFADHVGFGPKLIGRILRFQSLLEAARRSPAAHWTELAARAGYADQAHAIRDFRQFTGTTPSAWIVEHTPIAGALAGFEH